MSLSAGTHLGRYEILGPLGKGGMGEVYRAHDTELGRQVALKILPDTVSQDPGRVARFEAEAHALAALSHPNILSIHDFGQTEGRLYAVTELLSGESLRDRMSVGTLTWRKSTEVAASIADGLASAHAARIVHRDLKPENVFITSEGRVKILDFGLAKSTQPVSQDAITATSPSGGALSAAGEVVGTLSYMAPEQLRGLEVDGRADIFALGCILFEMLSGKRPFDRASTADTLSAILNSEPQVIDLTASGTPPALAGIVFRCLEKQAGERFDTAHDLAIALRSISKDQLPAVRWEGVPRLVRPRRLGIIVVAVVMLAAVGVLLIKRSHSAPTGESTDRSWGSPRQITSTPGWDGEPALSPDGKQVAYSSDAGGSPDIWVVDAEGGEPMRLTNGPGEQRKPAWFPDGRWIAYASSQGGKTSVWKVPRLGGSASLLIEDADMPAISPDGKHISFARSGSRPGGLLRIWTASLDHAADARRLTGDEGELGDHIDPAWSPDGSTICYSDFKNLWLVEVDRGKPRQLTTDFEMDREPVWSPSGKFIHFSSQRAGVSAIWRVPLDVGIPVQETTAAGPASHPTVSADSRRLVYSTASIERDLDILVIDRSRGTTSRFGSTLMDAMPAIAPDGSAVVYISDRLGKFDLWIQPMREGQPSSGSPKRLTDLETGPATPAFSSDGQWVAFFRAVKDRRDIWMLPVNGGLPVRITDRPGTNIHPAFSPDGSRLAFVSSRSGRDHVWILPLSRAAPAGEPWQLTEGDEDDLFPTFSPDGSSIAFVRNGEIWVTTPRRGAPSRQVTRGEEIHYCAWEPDGRSLLASGMWGTSTLRIRKVRLDSGATEPLRPDIALGGRDAPGDLGLSRDGRYLVVDVGQTKGNLWTMESRDGH